MKNKIINAMLYTWSYILAAMILAAAVGGGYLLIEMILVNLQ